MNICRAVARSSSLGPGRPARERVHGAAIERRGRRDVFRPLEAALDLERHDAETRELGHQRARFEILGREQIRAIAEIAQDAVDHELVGQPASLRARAAVRAAAANRLARQALSRVGDAKSAVHEHLELDIGRAANGGDVVERQLAREDDAIGSSVAREEHASGVGAGHLRRSVNR